MSGAGERPADIPQDVWDAWGGDDWVLASTVGMTLSEYIDRAIRAAKAEEREACSALLMFAAEDKQALRLALGEVTAQEMRTLIAGIGFLAAAIRKRGDVNTAHKNSEV